MRFSGGNDYGALSDKAKSTALDSIAREVIAFLNARGGDVIIGIREASGSHPRAEAITPIANPQDAADRISRGLSAVIEPAQTSVGFRAISNPENGSEGVLIIQARTSVRAPHRLKRDREVYARRGNHCVPMAMDEIQDVTLFRARLRQERLDLLDRHFEGFRSGGSEFRHFEDKFVHFRAVFFPLSDQDVSLDGQLLAALCDPGASFWEPDGEIITNDVAFRGVGPPWRPILRGRKIEDYQVTPTERFTGFKLASIRIKESGIAIFDFAIRYANEQGKLTLHELWVVGYFARICTAIHAVIGKNPNLFPAVLRTGIHVRGDWSLSTGPGMWTETHALPHQQTYFPDFHIVEPMSLGEFFRQAQVDLLSLAGQAEDTPYSWPPP